MLGTFPRRLLISLLRAYFDISDSIYSAFIRSVFLSSLSLHFVPVLFESRSRFEPRNSAVISLFVYRKQVFGTNCLENVDRYFAGQFAEVELDPFLDAAILPTILIFV